MDRYFRGTLHKVQLIFKIQKNIIRIIIRCRSTDSHTESFKNLKLLPLQSQYRLPLLLLVLNNKKKFKLKSDVCCKTAGQKYNFYQI